MPASLSHNISNMPVVNKGEVALRGFWLRLVQALWLVLVLMDLVTLVIGLPAFYGSLFTVCTRSAVDCPNSDQLSTQTLSTLLHAGFSLNAYAFYVIFLDLLTTLPFLLIGALIVWRKSDTWMGLFVSFLLINIGSLGLSFAHTTGFPGASSNPLFAILYVASTIPTILYYPCLSFFFATFPDGRFVPRWSWALLGLWVVNVFFWMAGEFAPGSPLWIANWPPLLETGWLSIVFGGSACMQLYRFLRTASPIQRQQIKWQLYGFVPVIVLPLCLALYMTFVPALNRPGASLTNTPNSFLLIVTLPLYRFWYLPVPFCIGIALLRYRLWDIDRVINRTLVYGLLTASLLGIYLLLVFGGQYLLAIRLEPNNPGVLVVSTLIVAALFQPLRRGIQNVIDRRFYRQKYDASRAIERFSASLRGEVNLAEISEQLVAVVAETMQPTHVSLWICPLRERKSEQDLA